MYVIDEDDIDNRDAYYLLSLEPKDRSHFLEKLCWVFNNGEGSVAGLEVARAQKNKSASSLGI